MKQIGILSLMLFSLCGCYFVDPGIDGEIAPWHNEEWIPPPCDDEHDIPILPEKDEVWLEFQEHKNPWTAIELIDIALRNNPLTRESWENAKAAAYHWRASESILFPYINFNEQLLLQQINGSSVGDIEANASASTSGSSNAFIPLTGAAAVQNGRLGSRAFNYNQWFIGTVSFSYLMFDFGGRLATIESARQALLSANWMHNRNLQTIVLTVLTDYYLYLQAKALFSAREQDVKNAQESFNAAQGRFEGGVATKVDVLLAQSNLANAKLLQEQERGIVKISFSLLATSIGLPANSTFEVEGIPEDIKFEKIHHDIDELIAIARSERPDLGAAEATWKEQVENVKVAWSAGMPTFSANANLQQTKNIHHPSLSSQLYNGSIMFNFPIFSGFLYYNQTRRAKATANAAYAAWKEQEENVIQDVVTSYYNFQTAIETVKFSEEYYVYTNEAYVAALASYKNGVGTILDVLAAQSALSNARAQRIQARTQWITSLTNVAYATGQLTEPFVKNTAKY